ncbi:MAG: sensor histidine kinase [Chloroflexi bacterium]|nr:sensor histidine kinase [Chloroflexota bacterium]
MADSTTQSKAVVVQTQEEERYRLARALQNGPAQILANAALEIETSLRLMDDQPAAAREGLTALISELRNGLADVRDLIAELQPPLLHEFGLAASLAKLTDDFSTRTGLAIALSGWQTLADRLPSTMEMAIFRIIQEALENVQSHAHATEAQIILEQSAERLVVTVADNGRGFATANEPIPAGRRLGIVAMSDRAELLGGQLQVFSEPARGVRVVLTVPLRGRAG